MEKKVIDLIGSQTVVQFLPNDTVEYAIEKLTKLHITSAPVIEENKNIYGLVDVLDLLTFLVKTATKTLVDEISGESRKLNTDDMQMLRKRSKDFNLAEVRDLVDYSHRNPFVTLFEDQTVKEALGLFSEKGVHRLIVLKRADKSLAGILSQTNVIFALSSQGYWEQFLKPVSELTHKSDKLITIPQAELAIDGFIKMHENNLSSIAVLGYKDDLIGNLSAADIRFGALDFTHLLRSVRDYLQMTRQEESKPYNFLVSCSPNTSIADAIKMMEKEKVHRIYLIDEMKKPLSVVSFTDILKEIHSIKSK